MLSRAVVVVSDRSVYRVKVSYTNIHQYIHLVQSYNSSSRGIMDRQQRYRPATGSRKFAGFIKILKRCLSDS